MLCQDADMVRQTITAVRSGTTRTARMKAALPFAGDLDALRQMFS